jgi:aspartate/methionine/tyrosine aminotransferase
MLNQLTKNKWGFSVSDDNPFVIFWHLQRIAKDSVSQENIIDLSRGDPGYGFAPSKRGRRFFSYLVFLDTFLNNSSKRFAEFSEAKNKIFEITKANYEKGLANELLGDLDEFTSKVCKMASECGLEWREYDVLYRIFRNSAVSGGMYLEPQGEELTRVILADWYKQFISVPLDHNDFVLTYGASHAIGTLFKSLGSSGINFLNEESTVFITSPAYYPYNMTLGNRNMPAFVLSVNPLTGDFVEESLKHLEKFDGEIKAIVLIDPNNPTGFSLSDESIQIVVDLAKKHDALIISDEVYTSFFPKKKTLVDYCPERTVRIDSRSKIERSTGLRFGDMFISKQANDYITNKILHNHLVSGLDFKSYMIQAKGPGGSDGELQHTTFVPGPSQFMGIAHMVLGGDEREEYFKSVKSNVEVFVNTLVLPHKGNLYYIIFDMNGVKGNTKKELPAEEKLFQLAKLGVVFLPACLFFSEYERTQRDMTNMIRASVVNTSTENVKKAAEIVKEYLCTMDKSVPDSM